MFPTLPLSYCTNVHPGPTLADVLSGLRTYTGPLNEAVGPVAAGLWLCEPVVSELSGEAGAANRALLRQTLDDLGLMTYTLNAFPQSPFHAPRVKEEVYRPTWADGRRLEFTTRCAEVLAGLIPTGVEGSLSTVPLGHPGDVTDGAAFRAACVGNLLELSRRLDDLHDETGTVIRLAIEPEPSCVLETTPQTIAFFEELWAAADAEDLGDEVRRHVGVCYDVCHQAVEFEDAIETVRKLRDAGVRIVKVHISCALETDPSDAAQLEALAAFAEPRYLHQTTARLPGGRVAQVFDLTAAMCETPPEELAGATAWRTHFHVPVNAEAVGPLKTTKGELRRALRAVNGLPYAPHLEVETYTWNVLPGETADLVTGLSDEVRAARAMLSAAAKPEVAPAGPMVTLG